MIDAEKDNFPVALMCRMLKVSRSGYYAWCAREPSERAKTDQRLLLRIREVFTHTRGRYGSPRVHERLKKSGEQVGRRKVCRLMREHGMVARRKKR